MQIKKSEPSRNEKPLIIPIFIMNKGCPNRCIFCNEKIAAGNFAPEVTKTFFESEVASYLKWNRDKLKSVEIAFYGGNFTGLPVPDQKRLLDWADVYLRSGQVQSLRISTRPDGIDEKQLEFLKARGVGTIELGAQSFNDEVLRLAGRGHDARSIARAMKLLQAYEFHTGLHLMAGLPGDSKESYLYSLEQTVQLRPDTVRIHPVIVFADTQLAAEYHLCRYRPLSLHDAVFHCFLAWEILSPGGIRIIRFGLQKTPEMDREGAIVAGPMHPAFGSLVYSAIYYDCTLKLLSKIAGPVQELRFEIDQRDLSNFRGYKNKNMEAIKKLYPDTHIIVDSAYGGVQGQIILHTQDHEVYDLNVPGI